MGSSERISNHGLRIAVVDDQGVDRRLLEANLTRRFGYKINSFKSGEALIKWIKKGEPNDLILVDQIMPGGISGLMTFQQLKSINVETPVVMTTSFASQELVMAFMREGGADFIPKPITDWDVMNIQIRRVVEEHRRKKELEVLSKRNRDLEMQQEIYRSFCGMVSHEFRKPLSIIQGYAEFLMSDCQEISPQNRKNVEYVEIYAKRLSMFLNSLVYVCNPDKERKRLNIMPIDTMQLLVSAVKDLRMNFIKNTANLSLEGFVDSSILVDPDCFFQVILNLVENATKYSGKCPDIKIVCQDCLADSRFVEILVVDNGIGIPEKELGKIFDHSKRVADLRDIEGSGLGLYVSKKVIEMMDGQIWVSSQKGKGSTFGLRLKKEA